jgi:circadian clock protein KaiB
MTARAKQRQVRNGRTGSPKYRLRLFVAGEEPNSVIARASLDEICSTYLKHECQVEVIDVLEDFQPALEERVLVTPALVIVEPPPRTVVFGNLTDTKKVLSALKVAM